MTAAPGAPVAPATRVRRTGADERAGRWPGRVAIAALGGWGALHVAGGLALVAASRQGAAEGLASLGSAVAVAGAQAPTGDAARVTAALVGFHGLDVAAAGAAVLVLAVLGARGHRIAVGAALVVAAVLDVGLAVFLLLPGLMSLSQGLWGIGLLAVALVAAARARTSGSARADRA